MIKWISKAVAKAVQKEKKKEETRILKNTFVIVLSDFYDRQDFYGRKKRIPRRWDLGKVEETVIFFKGEERKVVVPVVNLELPKPEKRMRSNGWEEWQSNDFFPVPVPEDTDLLFRDCRMLMRLSCSAPSSIYAPHMLEQFPWVEGERVTVPCLDIIRQATYSEWMNLLMMT